VINTEILDYFQNDQSMFNFKNGLTEFWNIIGKSRIKAVQNHEEVRIFLRMIKPNARSINNYLEIGTSSGGMFYIVDSFLRMLNPEFQGSVGVDVLNKIRNFDIYQDKYKSVSFIHGNSKRVQLPDEHYSMIFIDGDHTYDGITADYNRFRGMCDIMVFHDIAFYGNLKSGVDSRGLPKNFCGVPKFWYEHKRDGIGFKEIIDFDGPHGPLGIGILYFR